MAGAEQLIGVSPIVLSQSAYRRPARAKKNVDSRRWEKFCKLDETVHRLFLRPHTAAMSNLKRKDAPGGHPPAKSAKNSKAARPSMNDAPSKDAQPSPKPPKKAAESGERAKAPAVSLLKDEEPIFPRGGGSVLTPLEQKQIQLEAKADAIREEEFNTGAKAQSKKKRKVSTKGDGKAGAKKKDGEDAIKVESLNFKVFCLDIPRRWTAADKRRNWSKAPWCSARSRESTTSMSKSLCPTTSPGTFPLLLFRIN